MDERTGVLAPQAAARGGARRAEDGRRSRSRSGRMERRSSGTRAGERKRSYSRSRSGSSPGRSSSSGLRESGSLSSSSSSSSSSGSDIVDGKRNSRRKGSRRKRVRKRPSVSSETQVDDVASWGQWSVSSPGGAKLRLHRSGSVSILSGDESYPIKIGADAIAVRSSSNSTRSTTRQRVKDRSRSSSPSSSSSSSPWMEGDKRGEIELRSADELCENWKSAVVVSSLHQAYKQSVTEAQALRRALGASEDRVAELLRSSSETNEAVHQQLQAELAEARKALEREKQATGELVEWKANALKREKDSLEALRRSLDDTSLEKSTLIESLAELRAVVDVQKGRLGRARQSAAQLLFSALARWDNTRLARAWVSWVAFDRAERRRRAANAERRRKEQLVRTSVGRMRWKLKAVTLSQWKAVTQRCRYRKRCTANVLWRINHRLAASALESWKQFWAERRLLRGFLRRLAANALHRDLSSAFWGWQRRAAQEARRQHHDELARTKAAHKQRMILLGEKTVARWRSELLRMTFASLRGKVVALREARAKRFFDLWRTNADTHRNERRVTARALGRIRNRQLAGLFNAWATNVAERVGNRAKVSKFVHRFRMRQGYAAFQAWIAFTEESLEKKRRARRVFSVLREEALAHRFWQWHSGAQASKEERKAHDRERAILHKFALRWSQRSYAEVFTAWTSFVETRKFLRRVMQRAVRASTQRLALAGFTTWKEHAAQLSRQGLHQTLTDEVRRREDLEAQLYATQTELEQMRMRLGSELSALHEQEELERERNKVRVIQLWKNRQLSRIFHTWNRNAKDAIHERQVLANFVHRWQHRHAFQAFSRWQGFASRRVLLRTFFSSMGKNGRCKTLQHAFHTWYHTTSTGYQHLLERRVQHSLSEISQLQGQVEELRGERDVLQERFAAEVQRLSEQKGHALERLVSRLAKATDVSLKSDVFHAFKSYVQKRLREKRIIFKFSVRMSNQTLSRAFGSWAEHVETLKHNRALLTRVSSQIKHRCITKAFRGWHAAVQERIASRAKVMMFFRRHEQQTFWRCFMNWKAFVVDSQETKQRARLILANLVQENLLLRFETWREFVQDAKDARAQDQGSEMILKRVISRMKRGVVARTFQAWSLFTVEANVKRERVTRFVLRWKAQSLSRAFDAWADNASAGQLARKLLVRVVLKREQRRLGSGFGRWASTVARLRADELRDLKQELAEAKAMEDTHGIELQRLIQQRNLLRDKHVRHLARSWHLGCQSNAFALWRGEVMHAKMIRHRVTQFMLRATHLQLARAFTAWESRVAHKRRRRGIVLRGVLRMQKRMLSRTFRAWVDCVEARRSRVRSLRLLLRFGSNMQVAALSRAWRSWLAFSFQGEADRLRQLNDQIHEHFGIVQTCVVQLRRLCVRKSIASWQRPALVRSFSAWRTGTVARRAQRKHLCHFVFRWKQRSVARCFTSWTRFVSQVKARRVLLRSIVARWNNRLRARGLRTWLRATSVHLLVKLRSDKDESLVVACLQKTRAATLGRHFRAWKIAAHQRLERLIAVRRLLVFAKRMRMRAMVPAFNQWKLAHIGDALDMAFLDEQQLMIDQTQDALYHVVSTSVLYSARCLRQRVRGKSHTNESREFSTTTTFDGPSELAHGEFSVMELWATIASKLYAAAPHLFGCDALQMFKVDSDGLILLQTPLEDSPSLSLVTSVTGYTAKLGQVMALEDVQLDARFNAQIDMGPRAASLLQHSSHGSRVLTPNRSSESGRNGIQARMAASRSRNPFVELQASMHSQRPPVAFVCVPIFDEGDAVVGLLQATSSNPKSVHFLQLATSVLSVASDAFSGLLRWHRALQVQDEHLGAAEEERQFLEQENADLMNRTKGLENQIASLEKRTSRTGSKATKQLRQAQRRIQQLEARTESATQIESQVQRLLDDYDHAMQLGSPPASPRRLQLHQPEIHRQQVQKVPTRDPRFDTRTLNPNNDYATNLRKLELEQKELAVQIGNVRSKLRFQEPGSA